MKPLSFFPFVLAAVLAACASPQHVTEADYVPAQGGPGYGGSGAAGNVNTVPGQRPSDGGSQSQWGGQAQGGSGGAGTGSGANAAPGTESLGGRAGGSISGNSAEMQAMCALQQRLQAAHSEQERQAILDQALPGMTPDLRQQHLEVLRQQCH